MTVAAPRPTLDDRRASSSTGSSRTGGPSGRQHLQLVPVAGPVPDRDGPRARVVRRRGPTRAALGGVPYLAFLAPGLLAATAMQSAAFEATFPIMGGLVWSRVFHAMHATPISPRDIALGNLAWIAARLTLITTVFTFVIVLFGAAASPTGRAGDPGRGPDRDGVRGADRGVLGDADDPDQVQRDLPVRDHAAVPVLGHVLPDQQLPAPLQALAWLTPLYHGVALTRGLSLGTIARATRSPPSIHVVYLHDAVRRRGVAARSGRSSRRLVRG